MSQEGIPKRQRKKSTVNLFVDSDVLEVIRNDASQKGISLNSKINTILAKYVRFYRQAEETDDTCIVPKRYFQFVIDNIDVEVNIAKVAEGLLVWIPALLNDLNVPFTLENFVKYIVELVGVNGRTIDGIITHHDQEGNYILSFTHQFGIRWSQVLSKALTKVIEELLHYRTEYSLYSGNFVIKILKRD